MTLFCLCLLISLAECRERKSDILKISSASIYANTLLSKCGLSNVSKADAKASNGPPCNFLKSRGEMRAQKIPRPEGRPGPLSSAQPPLTGETFWGLSPRSGGSLASVSESIGLPLWASHLGADKSFRFLVENITVNDYKRAHYLHKGEGEETLAEPH